MQLQAGSFIVPQLHGNCQRLIQQEYFHEQKVMKERNGCNLGIAVAVEQENPKQGS